MDTQTPPPLKKDNAKTVPSLRSIESQASIAFDSLQIVSFQSKPLSPECADEVANEESIREGAHPAVVEHEASETQDSIRTVQRGDHGAPESFQLQG